MYYKNMRYYFYENSESICNDILNRMLNALPPSRKAEADKLKTPESKRLCILAYYLYMFALMKEKGLTGVGFIKDARGKPVIPGFDFHMSLSHCKAGIACVISDFPIGIDVEEISRITLAIAGKICCREELALLEKANDKREFLCKAWVLKEAYSKLTGNGFSEGFSEINTLARAGDKFFYAKKNDGAGNSESPLRTPPLYVGIASEIPLTEEPVEVKVGLADLVS